MGSPIIDAIQQVGGKIIHKATGPIARDLGIIASGQLAWHYYIAAFGTTRTNDSGHGRTTLEVGPVQVCGHSWVGPEACRSSSAVSAGKGVESSVVGSLPSATIIATVT